MANDQLSSEVLPATVRSQRRVMLRETIEETWPSAGALDSIACGVDSFRPVAGVSTLSSLSLLQAIAAASNRRTAKATMDPTLIFNLHFCSPLYI